MAVNPVFFTCEVCGAGDSFPFGFKGVDYDNDPIYQNHWENQQKPGWTGPQFVWNDSVEALLCTKHYELAQQHELAKVYKDEGLLFLRKLEGLPPVKRKSNRGYLSQNETKRIKPQGWLKRLVQWLGFG